MEYKFQYQTEEERQNLLSTHQDKVLVEESNTIEGDFLIFADEPRPFKKVYTQVDEEEFNRIKEENQQLQQSVLEMTTYSASQDERLVTQEQALLELTTLVAGGNA